MKNESDLMRKKVRKKIFAIIGISYLTILLFFSGCKKAQEFEITGNWIFSRSFDNIELFLDDTVIEFLGSEFSGTVNIPETGNFGTYSVSVSNEVSFNLNNGDATYTGTWTALNQISGTFYWNEKGDSGTWSATR